MESDKSTHFIFALMVTSEHTTHGVNSFSVRSPPSILSFCSVVIHAGGHSVEHMLPVEVGVCWEHAGGGAEVHPQPTCRMGG